MKKLNKTIGLMISILLVSQLVKPAVFAEEAQKTVTGLTEAENGNIGAGIFDGTFFDSKEDTEEQPNQSEDSGVSGGSSTGNISGGSSGGGSFGGVSGSKPHISKKIVLTIGKTEALVNGKAVQNDTAPVIVNERTMLPIRFIAEELGADVGWTPETKTASVTLGKIKIAIVIGQATATVSGKAVALDSPAFIENGRTYLPLRFIMEELGADVSWDGKARTVTIIG